MQFAMREDDPVEPSGTSQGDLRPDALRDAELTRLDPNYTSLVRVQTSITAIPLVVAALVIEATGRFPAAVIITPVTLLALALIFRLPLRRYQARGYAMSDDRLRVVRGLWFRSDTTVPFGRVQHIDVDQGPLERFYNLATLTVHTAGTHNASVQLPGLKREDALAMRETIRQHIKRETL